MHWKEFANHHGGIFEEKTTPFLGGDTTFMMITFDGNEEQLTIQKKIRQSQGASSHYNFEELEMKYISKNWILGTTRLYRKNALKRIGKSLQHQYTIEGDQPAFLSELLHSNELQYLLKHPKSEFIILNTKLIFKTETIGMMKEDLTQTFTSFNILKNKIHDVVNS